MTNENQPETQRIAQDPQSPSPTSPAGDPPRQTPGFPGDEPQRPGIIGNPERPGGDWRNEGTDESPNPQPADFPGSNQPAEELPEKPGTPGIDPNPVRPEPPQPPPGGAEPDFPEGPEKRPERYPNPQEPQDPYDRPPVVPQGEEKGTMNPVEPTANPMD